MNKLPQLEKDKANHFVYGVIIYFVFGVCFGQYVGFVASVLIAAGKELYDKQTKEGCPELKDFLITSLGGAVALCCSMFIS